MRIHELKNYCLVLDKVVFVSAVFATEDSQGAQFNVRLVDALLKMKFPNHASAVLEREMLIKALKQA